MQSRTASGIASRAKQFSLAQNRVGCGPSHWSLHGRGIGGRGEEREGDGGWGWETGSGETTRDAALTEYQRRRM